MTMPGFTAEASLQNTRRQTIGSYVDRADAGKILAQLIAGQGSGRVCICDWDGCICWRPVPQM